MHNLNVRKNVPQKIASRKSTDRQTQKSGGEALRDDPNNGCERNYLDLPSMLVSVVCNHSRAGADPGFDEEGFGINAR